MLPRVLAPRGAGQVDLHAVRGAAARGRDDRSQLPRLPRLHNRDGHRPAQGHPGVVPAVGPGHGDPTGLLLRCPVRVEDLGVRDRRASCSGTGDKFDIILSTYLM